MTREREIGEVLFAAVAAARKLGVDAESALRRTTRGFAERYERFRTLAAERGLDLEHGVVRRLDRGGPVLVDADAVRLDGPVPRARREDDWDGRERAGPLLERPLRLAGRHAADVYARDGHALGERSGGAGERDPEDEDGQGEERQAQKGPTEDEPGHPRLLAPAPDRTCAGLDVQGVESTQPGGQSKTAC